MASIKVTELRPAGSELFQDSESFLNELSDSQIDHVVGGSRRRGGGNFLFTINTANTVVGNTINANTFGNVNTVKL